MNNIFSRFASSHGVVTFACLMSALLLSGCSGGGGGGSGGLSLHLSPSSVSLSVDRGNTQSFSIQAHVTGSVDSDVVVLVQDNGGSILPGITVFQSGPDDYSANVQINPDLPSGTHTGAIDVSLCSDQHCSHRFAHDTVHYTFVIGPTPILNSLNPPSIAASSSAFTLGLIGSNFQPTSRILWDGAPRETTFVSSTELTTVVNAPEVASGANHSISVRVNDTSVYSTPSLTFAVVSAVPTVSTISPTVVSSGSPDLALTVDGSGFNGASLVQFNGGALSTTVVSTTRLQATVPAALIANGTFATITVSNPSPGGGTSSGATLSVLNPVPSVAELNARSVAKGCGNFTMSVIGNGLVDASTVSWNGRPRATQRLGTHLLQIQVTAEDIAVAGTASITISSPPPAGGTSAPATFTVSDTGAPLTQATNLFQDAQRSGTATTPCPISLPAEPQWTSPAPSTTSIQSSLIVDGVITLYDGQNLVGLNAASGANLWSTFNQYGLFATYDDGKIFTIGNEDCCTHGRLIARRVNDGTVLYDQLLASTYGYGSGAVAINGMVYANSANIGMYGLRESDGSVVWNVGTRDGGTGGIPSATASGVYIGSSCNVYNFNPADGNTIWQTGNSCSGGGSSPTQFGAGILYVLDQNTNGAMYSADRGTFLGRYTASTFQALGSDARYFALNGTLKRVAYSNNGINWSYDLSGNASVSNLVLVNDTVLIGVNSGTNSGNVLAFDATTGIPLGSIQVGDAIRGLVVGNGYLVVIGNKLSTYSIGGLLAP